MSDPPRESVSDNTTGRTSLGNPPNGNAPPPRGESMDTDVKRLEDLQAIAESFTGVERSFAV